jgi:DNA-binding PadR family transcriptional regulator
VRKSAGGRPDAPLSEATFYILLSMSPSPKHGYAILKEVRFLSGGRVTLSTGTLYGAIRRLLEQGWIERTEDPHPDQTARRRQAYALTRAGRHSLDAETGRLRAMVRAVNLEPSGEGVSAAAGGPAVARAR